MRVAVLDWTTTSNPVRHAPIAITDSDGSVAWDDLEASGHLVWQVQSRKTVEYEPKPEKNRTWMSGAFDLKSGVTTRLSGRVSPSVTLAGQLLGPDSKPRSGVRVAALTLMSERPVALTTSTVTGAMDGDRRVFVQATQSDAEGRFTLGPLTVAPVRVESLIQDAPNNAALVTRDVYPEAPGPIDLGNLQPTERVLRVQLRALDASGLDVTTIAAVAGTQGITLELGGCTWGANELSAPLGGFLTLIGFDGSGCSLSVSEDPSPPCCPPGWVIVWNAARKPECPLTGDGTAFLDLTVLRGSTIAFRASAIHRAGVADQNGVAGVWISLVPDDGGAEIKFDIRALLGMPFENTHVVPAGRFHLKATCEDEDALWTAEQELVVGNDPTSAVAIELTRVR